MKPFARRPETVRGWGGSHAATAAALADPAASIAECPDAQQALRRRLALWYLGSWVGPLSAAGAAEKDAATAEQLVQLAAIHAEAGSLTEARSLVERALTKDPKALDRLRFIGLTAGLHALAPDRFARFAPEAAAAGTFRRCHGRFRQLVEANADSICVVGNAPSEVGSGNGPLIDQHALVIRFNNFAADPKHWPDYGRKTDIWVRHGDPRDLWRRPDERFGHIIWNGFVYWRYPNGQDLLMDAALFDQFGEGAPMRVVSDLATRLGAWPSAGLVLLAWLRQLRGTLDGVTVRGFALSDQIGGLRHYYDDRTTSKAVVHNWQGERAIFDEMMAPSTVSRARIG